MPFCSTRRRHDAEQRRILIGQQAELAAQLALEAVLGRQVCEVVVVLEVRVRCRAPRVVVDAVQDPDELGAAGGQQILEAHSVGRGPDLLRVSGAHGRDRVGGAHAGAQIVHGVAAVSIRRERAGEPWIAVAREHRVREHTLITDVVQGQHGGPASGCRALSLQHRRQRGVPIVAMQHVRRPVERGAELEGGGGERQKSCAVALICGVDRVRREAAELQQIDAWPLLGSAAGRLGLVVAKPWSGRADQGPTEVRGVQMGIARQ